MVKDGKDNHDIPPSSEHLGDTPEQNELRQKLQKEKEEVLRMSRLSKAELLHELEKHEIHTEKEKVQDFMRQADFPEMHPDGNNTPEYRNLQQMFEEIKTDHIEYPFFRRLFPNFIHVCESSRLGENFSRDILGLALGIGESLVSVMKLAGHMTVDTAKFVWSPLKTYRETRDIVS